MREQQLLSEYRQAEAQRHVEQEAEIDAQLEQARAEVERDRAEREARESRTFRGTISERQIDPLTGGSFEVTAPGRPDLHFNVPSDSCFRVSR